MDSKLRSSVNWQAVIQQKAYSKGWVYLNSIVTGAVNTGVSVNDLNHLSPVLVRSRVRCSYEILL
jgi:hypothetical protein